MPRRPALACGAALLLGLVSLEPARAETVLVTGANSGLGLEFVKQYAGKGWTVIATHRRDGVPESLKSVAAEHDNVRIERMDVASRAEVERLANQLAGTPIDVLINNAGIYSDRAAALNRAMQLVAVHEKAAGVTVLLLHPGAVLTERQAHLTFPGMIKMQPSVSGMIEQIDAATIADTGRFIQYDGTTAPW